MLAKSRAYGCGFCGEKALNTPKEFAEHFVKHYEDDTYISQWSHKLELVSLLKHPEARAAAPADWDLDNIEGFAAQEEKGSGARKAAGWVEYEYS